MEKRSCRDLTRVLFDLLHDPKVRSQLTELQGIHPELDAVDAVELEKAAYGQTADLRSKLSGSFGKELGPRAAEILAHFQVSEEYLNSRDLGLRQGAPSTAEAFRLFLGQNGNAGTRPIDYHAHIYFDGAEMEALEALSVKLSVLFPTVQMALHSLPKGPHLRPFLEIDFTAAEVGELKPVLLLISKRWPVLIHAVTGNDLIDHTENAEWLGQRLELNFEAFRVVGG